MFDPDDYSSCPCMLSGRRVKKLSIMAKDGMSKKTLLSMYKGAVTKGMYVTNILCVFKCHCVCTVPLCAC